MTRSIRLLRASGWAPARTRRGVRFADDPLQTPWHRFLDEVTGVAYDWLELVSFGYLPSDKAWLATGGTVPAMLRRWNDLRIPAIIQLTAAGAPCGGRA